TQTILSRTRLLRIVDELNLYSRDRRQLGLDEVVAAMRKDIEIELVQTDPNHITAFNVSYSAHDPSIAQEVTGKLTNLFINENLELRQQESEGTTKFLEDQLATARQNLAAQEDKVREFKGQHIGELPTQTESNLQILSGMQSQLQAAEVALNTAKQQRVYLETLLHQYRAFQGSPKSPEGAPMGLAAIDEELDKLKAKLSELSSTYRDEYPEIRNLKDQIAKTEKRRDRFLADLKPKATVPSP